MQRDAQSKSTCRQTSEQSAGSYEATRRREFRKKFVPTHPPLLQDTFCHPLPPPDVRNETYWSRMPPTKRRAECL